MSIFKCKMCGGALEVSGSETVAVCEYCGTKQTLPKLNADRKANLYDRANHFRRNNDFDKAIAIYEQILNEDSTDAESYWSLVLCRYGIEYVEEPTTHKRIPTVNRVQLTSIFDDEDYRSALQYADSLQKDLYETEAAAINNIQKKMIAISRQEQPFDVFICYKETDHNGRRTPDSVLAAELYHELTREGFKVFFSRITLEDKLGQEYEPYIFAALNSAKVMVVLGTKPEHFNAVWVKNEWSRYLTLIKNGARKILIPAYKDMNPYDLPEEFSNLQAQDMSKLGFMQDLVHGIKKMTEIEPLAASTATLKTHHADQATPLLERAFIFLEDGSWKQADEYLERVLDIEPQCGRAYLGKALAAHQLHTADELVTANASFDDDPNLVKAAKYGDPTLAAKLSDLKEQMQKRLLEKRYQQAVQEMGIAVTETEFTAVSQKFNELTGYKDAVEKSTLCLKKAAERSEWTAKSRKTLQIVIGSSLTALLLICLFIGIYQEILSPAVQYTQADTCLSNGQYEEALARFKEIPEYRDAPKKMAEARYGMALEKLEVDDLDTAIYLLGASVEGGYTDAGEKLKEALYKKAECMYGEKVYITAALMFYHLGDYSDAAAKAAEINKQNKPLAEKSKATITIENADFLQKRYILQIDEWQEDCCYIISQYNEVRFDKKKSFLLDSLLTEYDLNPRIQALCTQRDNLLDSYDEYNYFSEQEEDIIEAVLHRYDNLFVLAGQESVFFENYYSYFQLIGGESNG